MYKPITLLLLIVAISQLSAQEPPVIDSLKAEYAAATDTTKAKLAFSIGKYYSTFVRSPDSVQFYAMEGLRLSQKYGFAPGEGRAYFLLGSTYRGQQEYGQSLQYFEKARDFLTRRGNTRGIIAATNALGVIHWDIGNLDRALEYYLEATKLGEEAGERQQIASTYSNLGSVYHQMGDFAKADEYFEKSLVINEKQKDPESQVLTIGTLINQTDNFMFMEKWEAARTALAKAIEKSEALDYKQGLLRAKNHQTRLELKSENYERVIQLAKEILAGVDPQKNPDQQLVLNAHRNLAKAHFHLGHSQKALQEAEAAMAYAKQYSIGFQYDALETAVFVNKGLGRFREAVALQEQYIEAKDSLLNQDKQRSMQALQSLYETEKKERQLAELSQQTALQSAQIRQRNTLIISLLLIAVLGALAIYQFFRQRILKEQQRSQEAEQRLLRLQMNPHFLFNALSSIQNYLFDKADAKKAIHYLSRFAQLMRQVLEYSRETYISLDEEIRTLDNYLSLQQLRHNHAFEYEITVDETISRWETLIPPIMAQPFVENAIEHGKVHLEEGGKISVHFKKEEDNLLLIVEDNGIGRAQAQELSQKGAHKSLATLITKDRIQVLSHLTKKKFSFTVKDRPQRGTQVIFNFPIINSI